MSDDSTVAIVRLMMTSRGAQLIPEMPSNLQTSMVSSCAPRTWLAQLLGCFSKQCTSEMSRTLQTSTVYFSRVSYLFECNANDTYVLRMTHIHEARHGKGPGAVRYSTSDVVCFSCEIADAVWPKIVKRYSTSDAEGK